MIRSARTDDVETIRAIDRESGQAFRTVGLDFVADDEPPSITMLAQYIMEDRAWVAVSDRSQIVVGFVLIDVIDGAAHIAQICVAPDEQGKGFGRGLLEHASAWAGSNCLSKLTLTTFNDVPWNQPLYEHLGFRVLPRHEMGPNLGRLFEAELAHHPLNAGRRVAMYRDLT